MPGGPSPIPGNARWTWSDSVGWTWSGHPGSEGVLWLGRWTWYTLSKWTWSSKRYGRAYGMARDRHSRKNEVDLVRSEQRRSPWAGKGPPFEEGRGGPDQFRTMPGGPGPIPWGGPGPAILALRGFCGRVGGPGTPSQSGPGPVNATEEPVGWQRTAIRGRARWTWYTLSKWTWSG